MVIIFLAKPLMLFSCQMLDNEPSIL